MIRINVVGVNDVTKALAEVPEKIERAVLLRMSNIVEQAARTGADKHTKSGALAQSTYNRPILGGREIGHDPKRAPYAVFVHWGTGLYGPKGKAITIKPKAGGMYTSYQDVNGNTVKTESRERQFLRWVVGGRFVFARSVTIKGIRPDPWLLRAKDEAVRKLPGIVADLTKEI